MTSYRKLFRNAAFSLTVLFATTGIAYAIDDYTSVDCPPKVEYTTADGTHRVCTLRQGDSQGQFCLYSCLSK